MLQEYDFEIVHRPGSQNANADALSRLPLPHTTDTTGARLDHDEADAKVSMVSAQGFQHGLQLRQGGHTSQLPAPLGGSISVGVVDRLDTRPQPKQVALAVKAGVVLYEPFGGLCAGLEAVLRNGIVVQRYLYSDISPAARKVAAFRVAALQDMYPSQLLPEAVAGFAEVLPQDVSRVTPADLVRAGALSGHQWLVIAGPECKDFSPAGHSRGLEGVHAYTLEACIQVVGALQQLQPHKPPLYIVENAAMQYNFNSAYIRDTVFPAVCHRVGMPIALDAARVGSYAHRLRNFWQNWTDPVALGLSMREIPHPVGLHAADVLDAQRVCADVERSDAAPFYAANKKGMPRAALPTLVA